MSNAKKPNASQRLDALETKILQYDAQIQEMAKIIDEVDRKFIALAKRVNASITASDSNDAVDKIMQDENAKELKNMTDVLVDQGVLTPAPESEINEKSFVVGRHISNEGNEITPRLQFYTGSLISEEQNKFIGKKIGDMILSEDKSVSIEITEIYSVKNPDMEIDFSEDSESEEPQAQSEEKAAGDS